MIFPPVGRDTASKRSVFQGKADGDGKIELILAHAVRERR